MPKVVGYMRVATAQQAHPRISLESQRRHIEIYARTHGKHLVDVFEDEGYSANDQQRPGLLALRRRLDEDDVEGVIITSLDRLARSLGLWSELIAAHFGGDKELISLEEGINQGTIVGRYTFEVLKTIADWERLNVREVD